MKDCCHARNLQPQDRGYRIQYTIYFPDGTRKTKTKERKTKLLIYELYRKAENLEIGSRRPDLTRREIISALHERLITPKEAQKLSGGETVAVYDFKKIMKHYEMSSAIVKTPYAHKVDMRRAKQLKKWLGKRSLLKLTEIDIREYIQGRKNGEPSSVNIPDRLYEILIKMDHKGPYIFGGKKPLPANLFYKAFKEVVLRAGPDPSLTLHHTRHTYGSTLLQLTGGDLRYVQEKMRHADINTTKQYMHTIQSEKAPELALSYGEER